jgi:hypothetical protein
MPRTIKRQPFTVSTASSNFTKSYALTQTEFKGLCDNKNDVTTDSSTFADLKNVYLDTDGLLVSRAPFKFSDGEAYIIDQWSFGDYRLRFYRIPVYESGGKFVRVNKLNEYTGDDLMFYFVIKCITHECANELGFTIPVSIIGWENVPRITIVPIEDKIFVWLAGIGIYALNLEITSLVRFEDAKKYLYTPVHKLVINGIESDLEEKNLLTNIYKRRYQYSYLSSVNFDTLIGRGMSVNLQTNSKSEYLYDITIGESQERSLIYPYSSVGNNCWTEMVRTPRSIVMLRRNILSNTIEVSFDGKYFKAIPDLDGMLGNPILTQDGLYIVAFTKYGVAQCRLVAQESDDFVSLESTVLSWVIKPYAEHSSVDIESIDTSFIPCGYFETIDQFAYLFVDSAAKIQYLYTEWLDGTNGVMHGLTRTVTYNEDDEVDSIIFQNTTKMCIRYVSDEASPIIRMIVGVVQNDYLGTGQLAVYEYFFGENSYERWVKIQLFRQYNVPLKSIEMQITGVDTFSYTQAIFCLVCYYGGTTVLNRFSGIAVDYGDDVYPVTDVQEKMIFKKSNNYRLEPNTCNIAADTFLYVNEDTIDLPTTGKLNPFVTDKERILANGDSLYLNTCDGKISLGNIHKVDENFELTGGVLRSGNVIICKKDAVTKEDFFTDVSASDFFYIERVVNNGNEWHVTGGVIKINDTIRLRAYNRAIELKSSHPGNSTGSVITLAPWTYPVAPDWDYETWPFEDYSPPPWYSNAEGGHRVWTSQDGLPSGAVVIYGYLNIAKRSTVLWFDSDSVWYNIDGTIWTSQFDTDNIIELDELVGYEDIGDPERENDVFNFVPPDFCKTLNEHYFAYDKTLQITSTRYDEEGLLSGDAEFLLYLNKYNEQSFSNIITNLHPLSDTQMGVFTDTELWYINTLTAEDGTVVYTKPILSKTPVGCKYGSDVITALDGQALIFPTPRGITALAPQDFVATTEKSLSYLSDAIQEKYDNFYHDSIVNSVLVPNEFDRKCPSFIKIESYKYFILFYKYLDKEILVLDTRNGGWWIWSTPYPIKSIVSDSRLHVLMQMDFSPIENGAIQMSNLSLSGVSFVFTDREISMITSEDTTFPELGDAPVANKDYHDDTVDGVLNGDVELIYENEFVGYRRLLHYASPIIDWYFTSRKLHFGQINNYKAIKNITINVKGDETFRAKLSTKAFRSVYHPEQSDYMEVHINDIRTFVKRLNLMHVVDFQYRLENDNTAETQSQLKLNSLTIKYEIKEGIR